MNVSGPKGRSRWPDRWETKRSWARAGFGSRTGLPTQKIPPPPHAERSSCAGRGFALRRWKRRRGFALKKGSNSIRADLGQLLQRQKRIMMNHVSFQSNALRSCSALVNPRSTSRPHPRPPSLLRLPSSRPNKSSDSTSFSEETLRRTVARRCSKRAPLRHQPLTPQSVRLGGPRRIRKKRE